MSNRKTLIIATAGAALALVGIAALRRSPAPSKRSMSTAGVRRRPASIPRPERVQIPRPERDQMVEIPPHHVVLPLAFWDAAAELDTEDDLPRAAHALGATDDGYDSVAIEDASATWLARATQSTAPTLDDIDDPAEIAADSMSMVSEASRAAAGANSSGFEDTPASQRG